MFIRTAESGSFSQAGRDLALSQPSVSRIISELEARLGTALLLRSTRRIALTDAGALFLDRAREVLADLEDAEDAARGVDSPKGAQSVWLFLWCMARERSSLGYRNSCGCIRCSRWK